MKLVIVESPKKTVSIGKILGKDYVVLGCGGHFMELQDGKKGDKYGFYGIDIANNFAPTFSPDPAKAKFIAKIREQIKNHKIAKDDIYLATDDDREGEAIAWHLANTLALDSKRAKRMSFRSITEAEIKAAIAKPGLLNQNRVDSALARQITDKIVGYEVSPVLWKQIGKGLSAGRVQSVVTRMVVDLEKELQKFVSKSYFTIQGTFYPVTTRITNGKKGMVAAYTEKLESYELASAHMNGLLTVGPQGFKVASITSKESLNHPSAPFVTSSLQQEASNRFHWTPKSTMSVAQSLYEKGLITYMRTDSSVISPEAFEKAKAVILTKYGSNYYNGKQYESVAENSQEAHEAIRPTNLDLCTLDSDQISEATQQEIKLYDLIWKRTIASQMSPEKLLTTSYTISPILMATPAAKKSILAQPVTKKSTPERADKNLHFATQNQPLYRTPERADKNLANFVHNHVKTIFQGFKVLYKPCNEADEPNDADSLLDNSDSLLGKSLGKTSLAENSDSLLGKSQGKTSLAENSDISFPYHLLKQGETVQCQLIHASENATENGNRYTEASLIRKMEKDGIGRPSTWASMIDKVQEKGYVQKRNIPGKDWNAKQLTISYGCGKELGQLQSGNSTVIVESSVKKKTKSETNKLVPTDLGYIVTEFLEKEFSEIMDYKFTAQIESCLDLVLHGKKVWQDAVREYWNILYPKLNKLKNVDAPKEKDNRERYLGIDPNDPSSKLYATIARYGVCIRKDTNPNVYLAPSACADKMTNLPIKPIIKPLIKLKEAEKMPLIKLKEPTVKLQQDATLINTASSKNVTGLVPLLQEPQGFSRGSLQPTVVAKNAVSQYYSVDKQKYSLESITLENALEIIKQAENKNKCLGKYQEHDVFLKTGKFGPYLEHNKKTISVKDQPCTTLDEAIKILETPQTTVNSDTKKAKRVILGVGELLTGKYGSYIKLNDGKGNVGLKLLKISETEFMKLSDTQVADLIASKNKN
jgi:DNA topoisomerase I